jgi:membrane-anchored protein YejM (alkaline phosphatase superfamily)
VLRRRERDSNPEPEAPAVAPRPTPPPGAGNFVVVVLDSLRYDSWLAADMPTVAGLGPVQRRFSYASWTAPSHYNLLMGLLPHASPTNVYASEYYKQDFARYAERLNVPGIEFKQLLPSIYLPTYLHNQLGYRTAAFVSMPVLNRHTPVNRDFDDYELMPKHNDMAAMVDRVTFDSERPNFYLLNVGETHYPYALPDEDPSEWPVISGVHGVFKHLDSNIVGGQVVADDTAFFDKDQLDRLRERQIRAASYVDGVIAKLIDKAPPNTWLVVTSDHGELFGEDGYFGHGPVAHEKVFEVPFVEARIN